MPNDASDGTRSRRARRAVALAIGLALAAAVAWGLTRSRRAPAAPEHDRTAVEALLERRAAERSSSTLTAPDGGDPPARAWAIPDEDARLLFAVSTRGQRYDPATYHSPLPDQDQDVAWPEHADGRFRYRTNSLGLREDAELSERRPDLRVLVTGDSHSAGFCDNAESFANVVEARLARELPSLSVDVVNAANMGFTFHSYLGTLEKYRELRPHAFVVAVHGGNDFLEALLPYRYLERLPPRRVDDGLLARRRAAELAFPPAIFQGAWSTAVFAADPPEREVALTAALEVMRRIRAICAADAIELVVVLVPSPLEVEYEAHARDVDPVLARLELSRADVARHGEIGREMLRRLEEQEVRCLDAIEALREAGDPSFWRSDLHLSVAGHERIARLLEPVLVEIARARR